MWAMRQHSFLEPHSGSVACCLCRTSNDPAIKSKELRSKLAENHEIGTTRLHEVLDGVLC